MSSITFRPYRHDDLDALRAIMVDAFDGVSIDQGIERVHGPIHGRDWRWRKGRHLDEDIARDAGGLIVAEAEGQIIGFISTWIDHQAGLGHIPNLSLRPEWRGRGIGRQLIQLACDRFRAAGLTHAKIETLEQNAVGNHLYTDCGFREVARQVHFVADLRPNPESHAAKEPPP
ncbi:MAG: GNAT family N-acetyltransferase [Planctomycetales bacterium]|nr:GNAT family N-acetyltransferase [Planctomycetales bacterium]